jgi:hypothetical protein
VVAHVSKRTDVNPVELSLVDLSRVGSSEVERSRVESGMFQNEEM